MRPFRSWVFLSAFVFWFTTGAIAKVDRVEITRRSDVLEGKAFGLAGRYEKIVGRVYFKVRPDNPHNRRIIDLDKAERNASGEVEFSADFYVLRPRNGGNHVALFEVSNRGRKSILAIANRGTTSFDPTQESDFGDGFLMENGYTVAWLGWQWDVRDEPGLLHLYAPIAKDSAGPIRGLVRSDFTPSAKTLDAPVGHVLTTPSGTVGGIGYPVADPANPQNVLTVRDSATAPRRVIPRTQWDFAREVDHKVVPDKRYIHLKTGFEAGKIYEVVYVAQDPAVAGLGLAAVRDFISYLKHGEAAVAPVRYAYGVGISQSGRFLRHFLYQDFNDDEQGQQVFDGIIAHVAGAGRGSFNHRFAQPSRDAQPMSSVFYPTDIFPFTDLPEADVTGSKGGGLLDATTVSNTVPKIFFTNTSYEYWSRAASLIHTDAQGKLDARVSDHVRIYLLAGLQHFTGPFPPAHGDGEYKCQQKTNPNPVAFFWRALITDMDQWAREGIAPPASVYPHLADASLVPPAKLLFPRIPGVKLPQDVNLGWRLDFGPDWNRGIISNEPPKVLGSYPALVPQVDKDGNDLGGVRLPSLTVPLATYTGWNLRDPSIGAPTQRCSFVGSYIPFAKTAADRRKTGDPRLSITERYQSRAQYMGLYAEAALALIKQRFLLQRDLAPILERGEQEWMEANK
ncbi:MAG TPA: alpha/beta hydrolase domain-containing protein [Terriglobales bacterium]|nr:alpha/beta hydrolase domain-containing protein [Terriglobales bacterium]